MKSKIAVFCRLIRLPVCIAISLSFIVAVLLNNNSSTYTTDIQIGLTLFSLFFLTAGGFILNDYNDIDRDVINNPNRPLVNNTLDKKTAYKIYITFFFLGIIFSLLTLNYKVVFLTLIIFFLLLFYSIIGVKKLLKPWLICNTITALLCCSGWFYAWSLGTNINVLIYPILLTIAFIFPREILKDIHDVKGDKVFKLKTLPCIYGEVAAFKIVFILFLIFIILSWLLFYPIKVFNIYYFYLIPVLLSSILLYYLIDTFRFFKEKKISLLLNLTSVGFFIGIIAIFLGYK